MASNSKGRNAAVDMQTLEQHIDPNGVHVLNFSMSHNDVEMRTWWLMKSRHSAEPVDIWMDVDFDVFYENTIEAEIPDDIEC